jgi:hypothetical protein
MLDADSMSCGAQVYLAKKETEQNSYYTRYLVDHPACPRFQDLMDREREHALQKTVGSSKKLCIDKKPAFSEGPWSTQFQNLLGGEPLPNRNSIFYTKFDEWTSAKFGTKF